MHVSPLVLPIGDYDLETRNISGSTSFAVSEDVTLTSEGEIVANPTITVSATGDVFGRAVCVGDEDIAFSTTGLAQGTGNLSLFPGEGIIFIGLHDVVPTDDAILVGTGRLFTSESIAVGGSATAQTSNLVASTSIAFSETGLTEAIGSIFASEDIAYTVFGTILNPEEYNVSPIILPISRSKFTAGSPIAQGATSFGFSETATLTGTASFPSNLQATTTVAEIFNFRAWLEGRGELQATGTIDFPVSGKLTANKLFGVSSIDFSDTSLITATGQLQASISGLSFSELADIVLIKAIQGSTSIALSETGATTGTTGALKAATVVRFLNPGSLITFVFGSTGFDITVSGNIVDGTVAIVIPEPDIRLQSLDGTIRLSPVPETVIRLESLDSEVKLWQAA